MIIKKRETQTVTVALINFLILPFKNYSNKSESRNYNFLSAQNYQENLLYFYEFINCKTYPAIMTPCRTHVHTVLEFKCCLSMPE